MLLINPDTIAAPASAYSQGVLLPSPGPRLVIAGQIGVRPDGTIEEGFAAQSRRAWSNLFAVLEAAGMDKRDLVKVTVFVTLPDVVEEYRAIRAEMLEGHRPAMTYLVVAGLAAPELLVEIEGEAVRAGS